MADWQVHLDGATHAEGLALCTIAMHNSHGVIKPGG